MFMFDKQWNSLQSCILLLYILCAYNQMNSNNISHIIKKKIKKDLLLTVIRSVLLFST